MREPAGERERVEWLRQNAVAVASLNDDEDFSDLIPLKDLVSDARIVMLGEATHSDGSTYEGKIRLVKFLHQEMGFEVVAFESSAIGARGLHEMLRDTEAPVGDVAPRMGWSQILELDTLFEYIRAHSKDERPLILDGFDFMLCTRWAERRFLTELLRLFDDADPAMLTPGQREFVTIARAWSLYRDQQAPSSEAALVLIDELVEVIAANREVLAAAHSAEHFELMRRTLEGYRHNFIYGKGVEDGTNWNIRDRGMASNAVWLARHVHPERKLILWAASAHTARDLPDLTPNHPDCYAMGHGVHEAFGGGVYSIAFIAHSGANGAIVNGEPKHIVELSPAKRGGIEDLLEKAGFELALVDLKWTESDHWLHQPLSARPMGHGQTTAEWRRHFDAFFFVRTNRPMTGRPLPGR
jgi:erythromycin esterase